MGRGGFQPGWLLRRRAARLLARVDRDPSPANLAALEQWRAAHPRQAEQLRTGEGILIRSAALSADPAAAADPLPVLRTSGRSRLALAASIAGCLIIVSALLLALQRSSQPLAAVLLTTAVGEIREVPLSDGSRLILDTDTRVRVEIGKGRRHAVLEHGRARFSVASAKTPFAIRSSSAAVLVHDGVLDVSSNGPQPDIQLFAGSAQVSANAGPSRERQLMITAPAAVSTNGGSLHVMRPWGSAGWPTGRLSFTNVRLGDVVAAANRYATVKIIIREGSVGELRATGVFRAGDAAGLARSLSAAFGLQVRTDDEGNFVLTRGKRRR